MVEILSPPDPGRDLILKRAAYARLGIPEYWIVNPDAEMVELLRLDGDGYRTHATFVRSDVLASPAFEQIAIRLEDVFKPI